MARLCEPPDGEEWLGRTLTEMLPLHDLVVSDADVMRRRLEVARLQPPEQAIATLRPAVELIRDMPFAGTGYLWPDAEGITSNLVLLATSAATELAAHLLSMGDIDGVFWATGQGLKVLPGHEELIALRMRAHRAPATCPVCARNGSATNGSSTPTRGATASQPPSSSCSAANCCRRSTAGTRVRGAPQGVRPHSGALWHSGSGLGFGEDLLGDRHRRVGGGDAGVGGGVHDDLGDLVGRQAVADRGADVQR